MNFTRGAGRRACAAIMLAAVAGVLSDSRLHGTTLVQGTAATLCKDELGEAYSQGAMRRVVDQIQACAAGMWILDPSTPPKDPPPANAKSCVSQRAADKGQEYGAGLLRAYDDPSAKKQTIQRCDNGSWKKVAGSEPR